MDFLLCYFTSVDNYILVKFPLKHLYILDPLSPASSSYYFSANRIILAQLPIRWVPKPISIDATRSGPEADHTLPFSAEVKMCGAVFPLLHAYYIA